MNVRTALSAFLAASIGCASLRVVPPPPGVLFESAVGTNPAFRSFVLVDGSHWVGHRFELTQPSRITGVGAFFAWPEYLLPAPSSHLFAAVIALEGGNDFPDSQDFTTPDCIGVGTFQTGARPGDAVAPMNRVVGPGWYFAAIGSNAFGAEFRGPEAAHLPTELEDNAPGQIVYGIRAGREGFSPIEGAPRFVVQGEALSTGKNSQPIASHRPTGGCS